MKTTAAWRVLTAVAGAVFALAALAHDPPVELPGEDVNRNWRKHGGAIRRTTAAQYGPERTSPVKRGEFQVDLVAIAFPDCRKPATPDEVRDALDKVSSMPLPDYYKEYSKNTAWPRLEIYSAVYTAPNPLGWYCRYDASRNLIGWTSRAVGDARAAKLRKDALQYVKKSSSKRLNGAYTCYVYCQSLVNDYDLLDALLRPGDSGGGAREWRPYPAKPSPERLKQGYIDYVRLYKPSIPWRDPLWPNSIPQVWWPGDGSTLAHELGHCLGAPDFYHASEPYDGVPGSPCLPWKYGPMGAGWVRYIYHAFLPAQSYPKAWKPGEYTLAPRSKTDSELPLGIFVPSSHPNYIFCIEYCSGEKAPLGNPSNEGLLVHAINTTMDSPMMGPPDLCYTYRRGDPDHKALKNSDPFLRPGDSFDCSSDPAAILPNLLPAGIAIKDIKTTSEGNCTFTLEIQESKASRKELDFALLPQTHLDSIDAVMPSSFRASLNVRYRGEPLLTEYGFCYGTTKDPDEKTGKLFPLYHRDRYDARVTGLKPGTMYYVRAYAKSPHGIRFSDNQKGVKLPEGKPGSGSPTLFSESDRLIANRYTMNGRTGGISQSHYNSANPLVAVMALANYWREPLWGGGADGAKNSAKKRKIGVAVRDPVPAGKKGAKSRRNAQEPEKFDIRRVHTNPSDSRPDFRMTEYRKLVGAANAFLAQSGLGGKDFQDPRDDKKEWIAKCSAAMGLDQSAFAECSTPEKITALKGEVRKCILQSRPVMVVRESLPFREGESVMWPLDIAFIDGLGPDDETFHVVFPAGCDRGRGGVRSGYMKLDALLYKTSAAVMVFTGKEPK